MREIFYIADTHFRHNNILKLDNRPWTDVSKMEYDMIGRWNDKVNKNDIVYILGDFCWSNNSDAWEYLLEELNGHKTLIRGNHDPKQFTTKIQKQFTDIKDYKEIRDNGRNVILSHYCIPFFKNDYLENVYMIYGHVHATMEYSMLIDIKQYIENHMSDTDGVKNLGKFYNAGCMLHDYTPKTLDELILDDK